MYPNPNNPNPNSNSSQPHHRATANTNLTRYGSAPSSVFESSDVIHSSQSNGFAGPMSSSSRGGGGGGGVSSNLTMSLAGAGGVASGSNPMQMPNSGGLVRHSSSPAGFLQQLATSDAGFTLTKGGESYNNQQHPSHVHRQSRLSSQLNFTNQSDHSSLKRGSSSSHSNGFSISPWEDGQSLVFSASSSKRPRNVSDELLNTLSAMDSQIELSEMMHIPEDSVACKVRAKRGCATHPRSIAERERRTRISGKLKKLQELVPNMDKQTSYSEMLDLAIQHIAGLQFQIQKLNKDLNSCTCGCNQKL